MGSIHCGKQLRANPSDDSRPAAVERRAGMLVRRGPRVGNLLVTTGLSLRFYESINSRTESTHHQSQKRRGVLLGSRGCPRSPIASRAQGSRRSGAEHSLKFTIARRHRQHARRVRYPGRNFCAKVDGNPFTGVELSCSLVQRGEQSRLFCFRHLRVFLRLEPDREDGFLVGRELPDGCLDFRDCAHSVSGICIMKSS